MIDIKFYSCLAVQIQNFINLRRLSGTDYLSQARLLGYFDRFLLEQNLCEPRIRREIVDGYLQSLSHLTPRSRYNCFSVVKQLCEYLSRNDPFGYVPEPLKIFPSQGTHQPYIYTKSQIKRLLAAASKLLPANSLRPHTYRTLLGVLYSTGIRIGEASALNLEDFHSDKQLLFITKGKFRKARWVPLSHSTGQALQQYIHKRLQMTPCLPDSSLFLNQRSRRLNQCTVNHTFRHLLRQCDIQHNKHTAPRIHDLRHTFAVYRLLAWYRDGEDVNARLPWLATYMGHVNIHSTQIYLRATPELLEQVDQRFHNYYLHQVNVQGETQ